MKGYLSFLKNRKIHYLLIIWILTVEVIDILAELSSEVYFLRFFEVLGFESLPSSHRLAWNIIVVCTVFFLCLRLLKDIFQISIISKISSKKGLFRLIILVFWTLSTAVSLLQFIELAVIHLPNPELRISKYTISSNGSYFSPEMVINGNVKVKKLFLNLSKCVFSDPFSFYRNGTPSERGTQYVGSSYFVVKNMSNGQKMIEMKFCGNGTDGVQGWFAYKISLKNKLRINENTTLILLLRLDASIDETAWTYFRIDFLSQDEKSYSLVWKFHDKSMNYAFLSNNGTRRTFLLGSVTKWSFFQFNLNSLFYTSFSRNPCYVEAVEYGVGAEADNLNISAYYLIAKISAQPLEINDLCVENVNQVIKLDEGRSFRIEGIHVTNAFVVIIPDVLEKRTIIQWSSFFMISKIESYRWKIDVLPDKVEMEIAINISDESAKTFINGKEIVLKSDRKYATYEIYPIETELSFIAITQRNFYLLPVSLFIPIMAFILYGIKRFHAKTTSRCLKFAYLA